jgi:Ca2+:H+ antiporter
MIRGSSPLIRAFNLMSAIFRLRTRIIRRAMNADQAQGTWSKIWFNFPVRTGYPVLDWLLPVIPAAFLLDYAAHFSPVVEFFVAAIAIVPCAAALGTATEELSMHSGPRVGGILNATFGNATELILGVFMLRGRQIDIVKASLSGSVIGNVLLVLGMSMLVGGLHNGAQTVPRRTARLQSNMLFVAMAALATPAIFSLSRYGALHARAPDVIVFSRWTAGVLILVYFLGLARTVLAPGSRPQKTQESHSLRTKGSVLAALAVTTLLLSFLSNMLVKGVDATRQALGLSDLFLGIVVIAVIGNVAEHTSALMMARRNHMELAYMIAAGSSVQIALLVTPLLIFASCLLHSSMSLLFTPLELLGIGIAVAASGSLARSGETDWFEGVELLALYLIFAAAVYMMPPFKS